MWLPFATCPNQMTASHFVMCGLLCNCWSSLPDKQHAAFLTALPVMAMKMTAPHCVVCGLSYDCYCSMTSRNPPSNEDVTALPLVPDQTNASPFVMCELSVCMVLSFAWQQAC